MAKDILAEAGLHFDELNKLRVLDPEVTQQTIELKEECKAFVDSESRLRGHGPLSLVSCPHPPTAALGPVQAELLAPRRLNLALLNSHVPPTLSACLPTLLGRPRAPIKHGSGDRRVFV